MKYLVHFNHKFPKSHIIQKINLNWCSRNKTKLIFQNLHTKNWGKNHINFIPTIQRNILKCCHGGLSLVITFGKRYKNYLRWKFFLWTKCIRVSYLFIAEGAEGKPLLWGFSSISLQLSYVVIMTRVRNNSAFKAQESSCNGNIGCYMLSFGNFCFN